MGHHHLSRDERVMLAALLRAGHTKAKCSRVLGVHRSTVSRELRRSDAEYKAVAADRHATHLRRESKKNRRRIENGRQLERRIIRCLRKGYSPEQVSREVGSVSGDALYAWIRRSRKELTVLLPQRGRRRHRYGRDVQLPQGWTKTVRSIAMRPRAANDR